MNNNFFSHIAKIGKFITSCRQLGYSDNPQYLEHRMAAARAAGLALSLKTFLPAKNT